MPLPAKNPPAAAVECLVDIDDLLTFVRAGFQADVVRTNHFAGLFVFNSRRRAQGVVGAALVAAGFGRFLLGNSHG